ncbi:hypothetical protein R4227_16420 [Gordonia amicalis]|uniref:hypothetical protein n=1 Tax=Gordonia amicalis TaxID=89053 RepID=UPI0029533C84|nr:hypothetical protein [Gordonia amicalis]MDV7101657.1 hypothetical protein [Gordonia amicalis]
MTDHTPDDFPERDLAVVHRERRIERATVMAVLHAAERQNVGFNEAMTDLVLVEHATIAEIVGTLYWALERIGRPDGPELLRAHLLLLTGIPDADD